MLCSSCFQTFPTKSVWKNSTYIKILPRKLFIHVQRNLARKLRLVGSDKRESWIIRRKKTLGDHISRTSRNRDKTRNWNNALTSLSSPLLLTLALWHVLDARHDTRLPIVFIRFFCNNYYKNYEWDLNCNNFNFYICFESVLANSILWFRFKFFFKYMPTMDTDVICFFFFFFFCI